MKIVILDRDGTLNTGADEFITSPDEWHTQPGAMEAVARLNHAGWHVVVVCNQPGLGRGLMDMAALNAVHSRMHQQLAAVGARVDAVFFCPHAPGEECTCREPAPGLLGQISERYGVEPASVQVVGSSACHLQAGALLGGHLHLVCTGAYAALQPDQPLPPELPPGTRVHASLGAYVDQLLPAAPASAARADSASQTPLAPNPVPASLI